MSGNRSIGVSQSKLVNLRLLSIQSTAIFFRQACKIGVAAVYGVIMLLVCPSCRTRYVVPDSAIGVSGRQVRCANCKNSWYQDGAPLPVPPAPSIVAPVQIGAIAEPVAVAAAPSVFEGSAAPQPAPKDFAAFAPNPLPAVAPVHTTPPSFAQTAALPVPPVTQDQDAPSRFAHEPPFKARRNPAKMRTMAAVAFACLIGIIGLALWQFGVPTGSFNAGGTEPDLKIVLNDNLELNERADGTPYFIASGSIVNPTAQSQTVPDMLITLKDAGGRPVYSWKMKAKAHMLAPGAKVEFSEARLDVPLAAAKITATWILSGNESGTPEM
jgi:predicted Zn finger-like uncharacterized protein